MEVDQFARHGLSCRFSQGRFSHHNAVNNIIHHALTVARIPSRLEPSGLHRSDGKCPDRMAFVPWKQGKYLVWDATCVDTFCQSHCPRTITEPGGAAAHAEVEKIKKYAHLNSIYIFQPVTIEKCGSIGPLSKPFLRDLGRRFRMVSREPRSYEYLMQRIPVAIQLGNATSVIRTLPDSATTNLDFVA